jgi:hypothetical protein
LPILTLKTRPILTYGYQGVLKSGVYPKDHTIVYSSKRDGPSFLGRERGLIIHKPIRIDINDPRHKLDPISRINYGKVYTVEYNVKVLFISRVTKSHEQTVITAFNTTYPPLSKSSYPNRPDSPIFSYAQGDETTYHSAMPTPANSLA